MPWSRWCLGLAAVGVGCGDADTSVIDGSALAQPAPPAPADTLGSVTGAPGSDGAAASEAAAGASCSQAAAAGESCAASDTSAAASSASAGADERPSPSSSEPASSAGSGVPGSDGPGTGSPDDRTDYGSAEGMGDSTDGVGADPSSGGDAVTGSAGAPGEGSGDSDPGAGSDPPEALPDLIVDGTYLMATVQEDVVDASADMCLFAEGCVNGPGLRRVVRFGTRSANVGAADVVVGRPEAGNPSWEFDACHQHFHFEGYASYQLLTSNGELLPIGNKNGFCLRDLDNWTGSAACGSYDCEYQGIGVGCADVYTPDLACQWIDITDVAAGTYELVVSVHTENVIRESDTANNSASVTIEIQADAVRVVP